MRESKAIKVVIDTNLWISFLIGKHLVKLKQLLDEDIILPVFSERSLDELVAVSQRPKLRKYFSAQQASELVTFLKSAYFYVEITSRVSICRDPKDNYLLALAKDSEASFLVTGDQDLLVIQEFEGIRILRYAEFLSLIRQSDRT